MYIHIIISFVLILGTIFCCSFIAVIAYKSPKIPVINYPINYGSNELSTMIEDI